MPAVLSAGLVAACVATTGRVEAQQKPKASGHGASGPGGGHSASGPAGKAGAGGPAAGHGSGKSSGAWPGGGGMPPGGMPPGMGIPGMRPGAIKGAGTKKPPVAREKSPEVVDPDKLPAGYRVPPEPPDALTTTDEWVEDPFISEKVLDGKQKERLKGQMIASYRNIWGAGKFASDADKKLVGDIVRWKLSLLTRKENRDKAQELREQLSRDIWQSPSNKSGPRDVRKFMLKTVAEEAPRLFKYHVIARINAAILLSELSDAKYNEADSEGRTPAVPCVLAAEPLLKLVNDKEQLTAPRVWGVNGLVRLAAVPEIKPLLRSTIVSTLVELMNGSKSEHAWYQWRLAEGLGRLSVILDQNKRPVVPQALAMVLADPDRPWIVRAEAAQSLGKLPYTVDVDLGLVAYYTAHLVQEMTDAYNKQPKLAIWKLCFFKVYGAFRPVDEEDASKKRGMLAQVERGTLAAYKRTVQEVFDLVLPLVAHVITDPEGMDTPLANLKKWIDANPPKSLKIHPEEDPIVKKQSKAAGQPANDVVPTAASNGGR